MTSRTPSRRPSVSSISSTGSAETASTARTSFDSDVFEQVIPRPPRLPPQQPPASPVPQQTVGAATFDVLEHDLEKNTRLSPASRAHIRLVLRDAHQSYILTRRASPEQQVPKHYADWTASHYALVGARVLQLFSSAQSWELAAIYRPTVAMRLDSMLRRQRRRSVMNPRRWLDLVHAIRHREWSTRMPASERDTRSVAARIGSIGQSFRRRPPASRSTSSDTPAPAPALAQARSSSPSR